jgi:hypothetical protein
VDKGVIVREQQVDDYEAVRQVYAEAFRKSQNPGFVPPEVGLFDALWEAGDAIPEFSFTAVTLRRARRPLLAIRLLPSDRLGSFRIIRAPASGAP